jgi:hypothetical protein
MPLMLALDVSTMGSRVLGAFAGIAAGAFSSDTIRAAADVGCAGSDVDAVGSADRTAIVARITSR